MKNQNYKIPMKQDDFSILEDKIYKLFIEIVSFSMVNRMLSAPRFKVFIARSFDFLTS